MLWCWTFSWSRRPVRRKLKGRVCEVVAAQEKKARITEIEEIQQEMREIETWQTEVEHLSRCAAIMLTLQTLHF